MFKKLFILVSAMFVLALACKKEEICTERSSYEINKFDLSINSENIGLFKDEGRNTATTIGSVRNQLMFTPEKTFKFAEVKKSVVGFDFIPSAYARRCVDMEVSLTTFDPNKTILKLDTDLDLSVYDGLSGVVMKGQNILALPELRSGLLKDLIVNEYLIAGIETPISFSPAFLKPLNGKTIKFTLTLVSQVGIEMTASVDVVVDVNA